MVLAQIKEFEDISVPRLDVNGESTGALVATLVDITSRSIVSAKHGDNAVRIPIGSGDVRSRNARSVSRETLGLDVSPLPSRPDTVNIQPDTTSSLGDHCASFQSIVDSLNRVVLHGNQEARRELRVIGTGVEQGWRGMGEVPLGHQVVSLENPVEVPTVNTNGNSHDEVLRAFGNSVVDTEKVGALKSFEAEAKTKCR